MHLEEFGVPDKGTRSRRKGASYDGKVRMEKAIVDARFGGRLTPVQGNAIERGTIMQQATVQLDSYEYQDLAQRTLPLDSIQLSPPPPSPLVVDRA